MSRRPRSGRFPGAWRAIGALVLALGVASADQAAAQAVSLTNTSRYVGDGRWDWTVHLSGSREALQAIRCVEYHLHSTFPNPARQVCRLGEASQPFALSSNGWGTFEVRAVVSFRNGSVQTLRHMLVFETRAAARGLSLSPANTAKEIRPGWWNWTIFLEGPEDSLRRIRCVEYTLHETFPDRVRTVCDRGRSREAFALSSNGWGTFTVGIRVILETGQTQELSHTLRLTR